MTHSTIDIRAQFPALQRQHRGNPVAYFDGPGGTQVPTAGRRRDVGLPLPPQRQHPLALPDQRRDRRGDRLVTRRAGRFPRCVTFRNRVWRQHDHPHVPSRAGAWSELGAWRRDRDHRARPPRQRRALDGPRSRAWGRRSARFHSCSRPDSSIGRRSSVRSRRRPDSWRSARRRTPSAR